MEKLVADLSARIKSLEKESIILHEQHRITSYSQPCHTGISEQLRLQQSELYIRKSAHLVHPNGRVPAGHSYILSSWEGFKKDMINTFGIADQTQSPSPRFVFWVKAPNHALRTLPHSAS
ncbi:hypothetical protein BASA81_018010 [Batrachochytrium salamandrivorans]|nr:hypothetical protein BASA81_018010 [Batrachochytrium salamandrivorans]